jgi:hypothetical protein
MDVLNFNSMIIANEKQFWVKTGLSLLLYKYISIIEYQLFKWLILLLVADRHWDI